MVIQRLQTLFLILAIGLVAGFFFVPFGHVNVQDMESAQMVEKSLCAVNYVGLIVSMVLSIMTMLVAIFSFKKPNFQKMLVLVSVVLTVVCIVIAGYVLTDGFAVFDADVCVGALYGGILLLEVAIIAQLMAYRGIVSDQRLLRSYDRFYK